MKGSSHFHSLTSEDNLALMNARRINKLVSEVSRPLGLMPSRRRDASKKPCSASLRGQCGASVQNDVTACICDSILNSEHFGVYYKWLVTDWSIYIEQRASVEISDSKSEKLWKTVFESGTVHLLGPVQFCRTFKSQMHWMFENRLFLNIYFDIVFFFYLVIIEIVFYQEHFCLVFEKLVSESYVFRREPSVFENHKVYFLSWPTGRVQERLGEQQRPQHQFLRDAPVSKCYQSSQVHERCKSRAMMLSYRGRNYNRTGTVLIAAITHALLFSVCCTRTNTRRSTSTWRATTKAREWTSGPCTPWKPGRWPVT